MSQNHYKLYTHMNIIIKRKKNTIDQIDLEDSYRVFKYIKYI
jgi:hypothetical protein